MIIRRILTNNAVVALTDSQKEKIVCGKGIAYKKKVGEIIDVSLINQTFILENDESLSRFEQLLKDVPLEYIELAKEIVEMSELQFAKKFNDSMVVTLSDHLYLAIKRYDEGVVISNALLWDIKNFYEIEYEIGVKGLEKIKQKFDIELPEDEAGFIALHIVNAQLDDTNMENIYKVTKVIQEITTIVKYHFSIEFNASSAYYYRFVTHLKFFALRLLTNKKYTENDENELLDLVKEKYLLAYQCAMKINEFLMKKYDYVLQNDEILYLTIHIHRVVDKAKL